LCSLCVCFFFFFQGEGGLRGRTVSGVWAGGLAVSGEKIFLGWGGGARSPRSGDEAFSRSSPFSLAPVQVPRGEPSSCLRREAPPPPSLSLAQGRTRSSRAEARAARSLSLSREVSFHSASSLRSRLDREKRQERRSKSSLSPWIVSRDPLPPLLLL